MQRRIVRSLVYASSAVAFSAVTVGCDAAPSGGRTLNTMSLPLVTYVPGTQAPPMNLQATGMRRKNFYIVEVDVYQTGFAVTDSLGAKARAAAASSSPINHAAVMDALLSAAPSKGASVAITLKFVRTVSTKQCVDAYDDALKGCNPEAAANFSRILAETIGPDGLKSGEQIQFFWLDGGGMLIECRGATCAMLDNEISRRLLETYLDPTRTVSAQLVKSFDEYLLSK